MRYFVRYLERARLPLVFVLAAACSSTTAPQLGEEFSLRLGEQATIADIGVTITFADVSEDSRCPSNVTCVWAGDAVVVIASWTVAAGEGTEVLHSHLEPQSVRIDSVELEFVRLDPYPEEPGIISPEDYVVTLSTRSAAPPN